MPIACPDIRAIRATDWSPALSSPGAIVAGVDDVGQAIGIILTTPRGSVPHRPEFASRLLTWIDRPIADALIPVIIRDSVDSLRRWEPRLGPLRLAVEPQQPAVQGGASLVVTVHWGLRGDVAARYRTEVQVGRDG